MMNHIATPANMDDAEQAKFEPQVLEHKELALFFNLSPDLFCISDTHGYLTNFNAAFIKTLGYDRNYLIGRPFQQFLHPDDQYINRAAYKQIKAGKTVTGLKNRWRCKNGRYRWFEWNIAAIKGKGAYLAARDITLEREAWQELENTRALLQGVLDNTLIGIIAFKALRNAENQIFDFQIIMHNKAFASVLGVSDIDWRGKRMLVENPAQRHDPESFPRYVELVENGGIINDEFVRSSVRAKRTFMRTAIKLEDGFILTFADITDRKQTELERERLIEELERFTYTVSHDLKTPLITIRGFLGYVKKDIAMGDFDRLNNDIAHIDAATEKMQILLDDLLTLSRVGHVINTPKPAKLREIIQDAVSRAHGSLKERGVHLRIGKNMPVVRADQQRLTEVFQNLIENGVKFMGEQAAPCIEIICRKTGEEVVCCVKDNGIGIEPRYQKKIFDLFERLDADEEGTGIGLALVRRIIEVHGGRIWVESEGAGHGSAFYFSLPAK